jgi:hypothetical protein
MEKPGLPLSSGDVDLAVGYFDNLTPGFPRRRSLVKFSPTILAFQVSWAS